MTERHTPEPWGWYDPKADGDEELHATIESLADKKADWIAQDIYNSSDAKRIVACVNALAGVDDPAAFLRDVRELMAACDARKATLCNPRYRSIRWAIQHVKRHLPEPEKEGEA